MTARPRVLEPRGDGELVTEVAREPDRFYSRIEQMELAHHLVGAIRRSVVDEHDLALSAERFHDRAEAGGQLVQIRAFVQDRDHERVGRRHFGLPL